MRAARYVWTISGIGVGVFVFFLLAQSVFDMTQSTFEEWLGPFAAKDGNLTFWGWSVILGLAAAIWLMMWRMLVQIHCRAGIASVLPLVFVLPFALIEAWCLGARPSWSSSVGAPVALMIMALPFVCLVLMLILRMAYWLSYKPWFPQILARTLFSVEYQKMPEETKSL